jgi:hypothetical protein
MRPGSSRVYVNDLPDKPESAGPPTDSTSKESRTGGGHRGVVLGPIHHGLKKNRVHLVAAIDQFQVPFDGRKCHHHSYRCDDKYRTGNEEPSFHGEQKLHRLENQRGHRLLQPNE